MTALCIRFLRQSTSKEINDLAEGKKVPQKGSFSQQFHGNPLPGPKTVSLNAEIAGLICALY